MFKLQFYILLVLYVHNSSCVIARLYDIGDHIWTLHAIVDNMNLTKNHEASEVYDYFNSDFHVHRDTVIIMDRIHERLTKLERFMNPKTIGDLFASDPMIKKNINTIELSVQSIDNSYNEFHEHMNIQHSHTVQVLENLTRHIIVQVEGKIEVIRKILTDGHEFLINNESLLSVISKEAVKQYDVMCDNTKTVADALVQIFTISMIAELKVNIMLLFVNSYRYSGNEGWKLINAMAREQFQKQFATYTNAFQMAITVTEALYMRRCDPPGIWSRVDNFVELEEAFQVSIFHYDREKCRHYSCNAMTSHYSEYCSVEAYNTVISCSSEATECAWFDSIDACGIDDSPRKFLYVNSSLGFYGKRSECPIFNNGYKIEEWKTNRAVCGCNCYRNHNQISTVMAGSNTRWNKVVVGLRFVRQFDTLYIQVREGHLQANGFVTMDRSAWDGWVDLPKPTEGSYETFDRNTNTFFLDDLRLPPDHVLIGVKFNKVTRGSVTGFALEIIGTKFNYKSGKMDNIYSTESVKSMSDPRKELKFTSRSSHEIEVPHKVTPVSIGYVRLQRSDLTDDFGQSTLPFFDSNPVITDPLSVLGGVGLFHKGVEGYAGFLSFRVYPISYVKYFIDFNQKKVKNSTVLFNLPEEVDPNDPLNWLDNLPRRRNDEDY